MTVISYTLYIIYYSNASYSNVPMHWHDVKHRPKVIALGGRAWIIPDPWKLSPIFATSLCPHSAMELVSYHKTSAG